jgi:predicted RNA-binding Zn ribbon-like protein
MATQPVERGPQGLVVSRKDHAEDVAVARLLSELAFLAGVSPSLAVQELRPFVAGLRERRHTCARAMCGLEFLQRSRHRRGRHFCSDQCRGAANRAERREKRKRA